MHETGARRRRAGAGRETCSKGKCAIPSALYRLAGTDPELSGWRPADLCGPCRRSSSFGDRLSGRRAMDRGRRSKGVVCAGEIPLLVPSIAERSVGARAGIEHLRGSRLLNTTLKLTGHELKTALAGQALALGFDCVGVTDPDAILDAGRHLRAFLEAGAH